MRKPRIENLKKTWPLLAVIMTLGWGLLASPGQAGECPPAQKQEADLAYASAYEFLNAGQWEQAVPRLNSILEICPGHVNAARGLGRAYRELGRNEEARAVFTKLITMRGKEVEAMDLANLGATEARLKLYKEARASYMKAQTLAPDDCSVLFNLGVLHMGVQDYRKAVETLQHAYENCEDIQDKVLPQLSEACKKAAAKERKIGNPDQARQYEDLERQYAGAAGGTTAYDMVKRLMTQGKFDEALVQADAILQQSPEHASALWSKARCLDNLKQKSAAISSYEQLLGLRPDNIRATAELIRVYAEAGNCQNGLQLSQEALERFQGRGQQELGGIYYAWGKCLECAQRYQDAKTKFQLAIASGDPRWVDYARREMEHQDQLIQFEALKKKKQEQGG